MSEIAYERKSKVSNIAKFRELGLLGFIIIISILVQLRNPSYLTFENLNDMIKNTAILSILSVGMMLVIVTRGIDLSIGATLALSGMVSAMTVSKYTNMSPIVAILIGISIGILCGIIVGFLVSKMSILPIIASLGMMNVFRGVTFLVSKGKWVSANQMPASFKNIATSKIFGINTLIFIAILNFIIFYYFINYTRTGRQIYAVGSNPDSAKISGINNEKIIWMVYIIMGALAGLAGVLWVSKFASAQGDTAMGYEMNVIAACVLGGVNVAGGSGKISGLILGSLLLGILSNALPLINVSPFWQQAIQGVIILTAIIFNTIVKRQVDKNNLMRRKI
ncbi:ABC transporter permease [Caloramator sp. E03]|uniref:ABC transporter permease n=1 Tax=Caloramator sp. E03 TaxID=2576307 RepID=UPI0011105B94|nr:ABC transporter permease [Caloramator sp. E03]QCX33944.1 ABC transporter permease [Caloramator sp. E03]